MTLTAAARQKRHLSWGWAGLHATGIIFPLTDVLLFLLLLFDLISIMHDTMGEMYSSNYVTDPQGPLGPFLVALINNVLACRAHVSFSNV